MTKDMTSGNSLKLIISFAIPMIIGNLLQQLYNMVDAIIVGKCIDLNALAAVGATGSICFLIIGFALGVCSGFCILVSQEYGANDYKKMRRYIINSCYLCFIIAVILTVLTLVLTRPLLELMKTPDDIIEQADDYLSMIFAGISVTIFYNLLASVLRALGDSRSPLIFLGIASVINIVLDYVFIQFCNMGVAGAGLATLIAQGISTVLCFIYMRKKFDILAFEKDEIAFNGRLSIKLMSIGVPMALQYSITAIGSVTLQTAINNLGTVYVASVTAAQKIQMIAQGPMDSLGAAMATYCGQNKGARKYDRIIQGLKQSMIVSVLYSIISCIILVLFGGYISLLFIDKSDIEVIRYAMDYLKINSIMFPLLGVLFIIRNSLQGLGYSLLPMMAGFTELIARVGIAVIFVKSYGYISICLASPVAWLMADIFLIIIALCKFPALKKQLSN
ncbi:MAG: MATE family efflux transporter [Oscillospiraceae bacterium]|nr:MATE family efflux transporter [Oscillospiraceae bacterium]